MTDRDLVRALRHDIEQIDDNVKLYREGRDSAYQGVAIQLRNILLGGRRSLLRHVLPNATLHKFKPAVTPKLPPAGLTVAIFDPRGVLELGGGQGAAMRFTVSDYL